MKSKLNYRVTPSLGEDAISIKTEMTDMMNDTMRQISMEIINLKDKAIREGLTKLGWTPPGGEPEQSIYNMGLTKEELKHYNEQNT